MVKDERQFRTLTGALYDFNEDGQVLEGTIRSRKTVEMENGTVQKYEIIDTDGVIRTVLGSAIMDNALVDVPDESLVRITYDGMGQNKKKQQLRMYTVEVAE